MKYRQALYIRFPLHTSYCIQQKLSYSQGKRLLSLVGLTIFLSLDKIVVVKGQTAALLIMNDTASASARAVTLQRAPYIASNAVRASRVDISLLRRMRSRENSPSPSSLPASTSSSTASSSTFDPAAMYTCGCFIGSYLILCDACGIVRVFFTDNINDGTVNCTLHT